MLLKGYSKEVFRPECNPSSTSVYCVARLEQDVSGVLPYLNARLGADQYYAEPPELLFRHKGKYIKVCAREIGVAGLADGDEADGILEWITNEINLAWENRADIAPRIQGKTRPALMEILKLLPKTNCKKCGAPTCMVFAAQVKDDGRDFNACPELLDGARGKLAAYLAGFDLEA
jgi:ArsR family metal-binding transcriptional regulator